MGSILGCIDNRMDKAYSSVIGAKRSNSRKRKQKMSKQLLTVGDSVNGLNDNACVQCGRKVGKNPLWVHVSTAGEILATDSDSMQSQGCWPVGSECAKAFDSKVLIQGL